MVVATTATNNNSSNSNNNNNNSGSHAGADEASREDPYDPELAAMEAWLDEHQEFTADYFIR